MTDDDDLPFSFNHVCDVLGLDPGYLRRRLRRWQEAHASTIALTASPISSQAEPVVDAAVHPILSGMR